VEVHASDLSPEQRCEPALRDDRRLSSDHGSIPRVGNVVVRRAVADDEQLVIFALVTRGASSGHPKIWRKTSWPQSFHA
jgi:hypothetical protein